MHSDGKNWKKQGRDIITITIKVHTVCLRVTVIENGQDWEAPRNECKCMKIRLENTTKNTVTLYLFYPTFVDGACYWIDLSSLHFVIDIMLSVYCGYLAAQRFGNLFLLKLCFKNKVWTKKKTKTYIHCIWASIHISERTNFNPYVVKT